MSKPRDLETVIGGIELMTGSLRNSKNKQILGNSQIQTLDATPKNPNDSYVNKISKEEKS